MLSRNKPKAFPILLSVPFRDFLFSLSQNEMISFEKYLENDLIILKFLEISIKY